MNSWTWRLFDLFREPLDKYLSAIALHPDLGVVRAAQLAAMKDECDSQSSA
jgi:hypothetical protein